MFDGFPDGVGLLWAIRDEGGRIVDFEFGYGNPMIMRMFQLPRTQRGRYTLLEALPVMRDNGQFDAYVRVCDTGEALSDEIHFDTPFGDGYIQGNILRRTAKLGDGLIVFVADVTRERRMESELRGYADMVAHDLREPITGHRRTSSRCSSAVRASRRRPRCSRCCARAPSAHASSSTPSSTTRAPASCSASASPSTSVMSEVGGRPARRASTSSARRSRWLTCPRSTAIPASCAACCRTSSATR